MDFFKLSSVAQTVKMRNLQKKERAVAHDHSLEKNVKEKAENCDFKKSDFLKDKTDQRRGSSKNMNAGENCSVLKKRKQNDPSRKKMKSERKKARSLWKQEMPRAQHVNKRASLYDPRRRRILKKNKIQQKGSSKHVNSSEKNSRVGKKRKRSYAGISSGRKIRRRTRKKIKFVLDDSLDDDGGDGPSNDSFHDNQEPDILILGQRYRGTINIGNSFDSEEDSLKFVDSDNSNEDDIVFLSATDTNTVSSVNSLDSKEDNIVFVGEINTNTVRNADIFEWKEIEYKESCEQGEDVEDSSERNSEEADTSESTQSEFATTGEQEDVEKRDEKQNDNAGTADSKLKNSTSRRKGKELSEFVDETSFDWSSESSPSIVAENNESDEFLSSSSSEPDDSNDEDFDIDHPYSPISEESCGSFEDEADEKEITTDADEPSIEEGSHTLGLRSKSSCGEKEVTVSIFQDSDRRGTANEMSEICDETIGSKENLYCDGVEERQCSKSRVIKGESSGKKSRISASNSQDSGGRESSNTEHEINREVGMKGHLGHDTVEEVDFSRRKDNEKVEDSPKSNISNPVQTQGGCACKKVNEPFCRKHSHTGMKNQKTKNRQDSDEILEKNHSPHCELQKESYSGEQSVSISQEPDRRDNANEMPGIREEIKGHKENPCCDSVHEAECLRSSVVKGESSGKKSRKGVPSLKESIGREFSSTKQDKEAEGLKDHLGHDEEELSRNKNNKKAEDLSMSTKSNPVQIQEDCACKRINEPLSEKQSGVVNLKRKIRDEYNKISKKIHGPDYEFCGNVDKIFSEGKDTTISDEARKIPTRKKATKNEESNMRLMVEDPSKENSNCHHYETLETSYSIVTCKNNEIGFNYKTNQKQKQSHVSKALIESMLGRSGVSEEKSSKPELKESCEPEEKQSSSTQRTLPLKFRFEDEESKPAEKSEYEIMVEDLFSEMYTWMYSGMSDDSPEAANEKPSICSVKENKYHPSLEGLHELVILEDIGEVCRRCNHVQREMKHLLPAFARIQGSACRKCVDKGHFSGAVDFTSSMNDFPKSSVCTDGTVWDMIPGVKETMYQHQQDGFEFLWKNLEGTIDMAELKNPKASDVGGCIISHAPGTGKTRLTMVFIDTYLKLFPDARPVIIAPASMLLTWEEEFTKWKVEFPFHNLNNLELSGKEHNKLLGNISVGKSRDKFVRLVKMYSWNQEKSILGISYQLFEKLVGKRHRRKKGNKKGQVKVVDQESENIRKILLEQPRLVVLDEGHTPRSQHSCIWNTLLKLQTERRIILSGTPFQNNFTELFNTFHLVRPTIASSLAKEKAFAEMIPSGGRRNQRMRLRHRGNSLTNSREEEAEKLIEMLKRRMAPFVHIHKGSILQKSLPGLKDCVILLNPPPQQKCLIEKIEPNQSTFQYEHEVALLSVHPSLFQKYLLSGKENSNVDMEMLTRLRRDPNAGIKTRFIMELVRRSKALNERVLIEPLRLIKDQLIEHFTWEEGKQIFEMQGKLDQKLRQSFIEIFNNPNSEAQVLLASTRCCSEGINLVGASRIVLLDVVWNPSVERQAISRAYRLGQKKVVFTYHLMTSGTTEGEKYCRQAEKDRLSELVFTSTNKEDDKEKKHSPVFKDGILKEMFDNANLRDMFEKIIYQPKEANLVETFVSASLLLR